MSTAKKQPEELRKKQERFEQPPQSLRWDINEAREALREQIAGEITVRETLVLELRGLLGRFEPSIAQLRLASENESLCPENRVRYGRFNPVVPGDPP